MIKFLLSIVALGLIAGCAWPPSMPSTPANQNPSSEPVASQAAPLADTVSNLPQVAVPSVSVPRVSVPRVTSGALRR